MVDENFFENEYEDYEGQIEHIETVPSKNAEYVNKDDYLPLNISQSLSFDKLYSHQGNALDKLSNGKDICVTTPTSSGKTLIYALQIARRINQDEDETALLIYPTKALSRDQEEELNSIYNDLDIDINVGVYDGDSSQKRKQNIRKKSNVIITNFQGLNYYLPYHKKWERIYKNLGTIVVDESHTYNGVQGIHVAWIIRRLRRVVENIYNADPRFILSSATIGNPYEHASRLTGIEFDVISDDGSPRGSRDIVIWNPPSYLEDGVLKRKSSNRETSNLVSFVSRQGYKSLTFVPSRKMTELCANWAQKDLDNYPSDYDIESYNAGHTKEDRRKVETNLKNSDIDGVISTTALELGIDIGDVDATIIDGYPGTRSSFWQQAGRSGRGKNKSLSILVSKHDSIDQHIVNNPEFLLDEDVEDAVIDLGNKHIMASHLCTASNEYPINIKDSMYFSEGPLRETISTLNDKGILDGSIVSGSVNYVGDNKRPESDIDLYSTSDKQFNVYIKIGEDTHELPSVDISRAYREFHPNAIYMYKDEQYKVVEFNEEERYIILKYTDVDYYTQSSRSVSIDDIKYSESKYVNDGINVKKGRGTISESYNTYNKVYYNKGKTETNLSTGITTPIKLDTDLMWIEFSADSSKDIDKSSEVDGLMGSLHAIEHALIKMSPTEITAESKDLGGLSVSNHNKTDLPTIFIYDGIEGGVGFSHKIYHKLEDLSDTTKKSLINCNCDSYHGCPACTMSSMCGDNNEPMDTQGAIRGLDLMSE